MELAVGLRLMKAALLAWARRRRVDLRGLELWNDVDKEERAY